MVLRDSSLVYTPIVVGTTTDEKTPSEDPTYPVLFIRHKAAIPDTVAKLRLLRNKLVLRGDKGTAITSQPYSNLNFLGSGADGRRLLLVLQGEPDAREGHTIVRLLSSAGTEVFRKELQLKPRLVSPGEWDSLLTAKSIWYSKSVWTTESKARRELRSLLVRPRYHPSVSEAVLGRDATTWLRLEQVRTGMVTWLILSPAGKELGFVSIPRGIRVLDATATMVVGVSTDADGVDHVVWMSVIGSSGQ